jgi:hypothetical protein
MALLAGCWWMIAKPESARYRSALSLSTNPPASAIIEGLAGVRLCH